jgi:hypothetical protein
VYSHRYYTEAFFVLVIFLALSLSEAHRSRNPSGSRPSSAPSPRRSFGVVLCAAALTTSLSVSSSREWRELVPVYYPAGAPLKRYMDRLDAELEAHAQEGRPHVFVDGLLPRTVAPFGGPTARHSFVLQALGHRASFRRAGRGVYRIEEDGSIVASRRPRPVRH